MRFVRALLAAGLVLATLAPTAACTGSGDDHQLPLGRSRPRRNCSLPDHRHHRAPERVDLTVTSQPEGWKPTSEAKARR